MNLHDLLEQDRAILTDGAWGTELSARGLGSDIPETWNLTHPDDVVAIAASYVAAGSDIILSNTFGGSSVKLARAGLSDVQTLNQKGAELSKQAVAATGGLVFASMGSTGELLGLTSTMTEAELEEVFAQQAVALAEGGADGIIIETVSDLTEALCAVRGVMSACILPVAVSMTFDEGVRGIATMMGNTPQQAAEELSTLGVMAVGANCGRLSDDSWVKLVEIMANTTTCPIWAKANAGIPELIAGKSVFPMGPDEFGAMAKRLVDAGARFIGGCCGTSPAHIAAVKAALEA